MRLSVSEAARLSGVSVRTLHYYDKIGLLHPSEIAENGYRYYCDADMALLQQILFFRELDFPLREITRILSLPGYDRRGAMRRQRELLLLKRERLDGLLRLLDAGLKGDTDMQFDAFDDSALRQAREQYAGEARERWGHTAAWAESEQKSKNRTKEEWDAIQRETEAVFRAFSALRGGDPGCAEAQKLVADWQAHITRHYYRCDKDILAGLGTMYTADERFLKNIDRFGPGTADFMSRAIALYCRS